MCKKINQQYLISYFDNQSTNVVAMCLTESKAEQLLPVIARCICYNHYTKIVKEEKQTITLGNGRVYITSVPVVTDKQQVYNLYCATEDVVNDYFKTV